MKKALILITINIFLPITLLLVIPSIFIRSRQGVTRDIGNNLLSFISVKPITFNFVSNLDNLETLILQLKNPSLNNKSAITVDITGPNDSRSIVFSGSNVGDPSSVPLKFLPFSDKAGTSYTITLTTDNIVHDGLYVITDVSNNPLYETFYNTPNLKENLYSNYLRQAELMSKRSQIHSLVYLSLLLSLNIMILYNRENKA
jgi:hypothetical protein